MDHDVDTRRLGHCANVHELEVDLGFDKGHGDLGQSVIAHQLTKPGRPAIKKSIEVVYCS